MNWRDAFLAQARSDNVVRKLLNRPEIPYCHQLHYPQMVSEKLAKGFATPRDAQGPPPPSHVGFVSFLRAVRNDPGMRRRLGYSQSALFKSFIDSVLPFAREVEQLAPSSAGRARPNPEYPWQPEPGGEVLVPCRFKFSGLRLADRKVGRLVRLLEDLLRVVN